MDCFHEFEQAGGSPLGRETPAEVVLLSRLRPALVKLNPDLPAEAITKAIEELTRDRGVMTSVNANREVYRLIKDGVRVDLTGTQKGNDEIPRQARNDKPGRGTGVGPEKAQQPQPESNFWLTARVT